MEIVLIAYDDDGKYVDESRVNSIEDARDFLSKVEKRLSTDS